MIFLYIFFNYFVSQAEYFKTFKQEPMNAATFDQFGVAKVWPKLEIIYVITRSNQVNAFWLRGYVS